MIYELHYNNTNTYLITCNNGYLMFDTGWAGTFHRMCQALGERGIKFSEIKYLLISHFHPDHMGLAGELLEQGVKVLVMESQLDHIHDADSIYARDKKLTYIPIADEGIQQLTFEESRDYLRSIGIDGSILSTPGHSDDSISLLLDSGDVFVGDLYPLYELEVHEELDVQESWKCIFEHKPKRVFYGHAKTAILDDSMITDKVRRVTPIKEGYVDVPDNNNQVAQDNRHEGGTSSDKELYRMVKKIMGYIDKGMHVDKISAKLRLDKVFVEDVCRMYLTHRNVSVQGILDRIEIKGK